jgi:hypothetical protein
VASQFPLSAVTAGSAGSEPRVYEAVFLSTDTSQPGDLVFFDTADNNVKKCGANPALILGICLGYAPSATQLTSGGLKPEPYATNKTPVAILTEDVTCSISSASTPALSFQERSWDLVDTVIATGAGIRSFWQLVNTQANQRIRVIDIDITNGIFFVRFVNANLQGIVT